MYSLINIYSILLTDLPQIWIGEVGKTSGILLARAEHFRMRYS